MLNIRDLTHPYIAMTQNQPLSIDISAGMCLWIKGDNGAGKSTLLKLIAGVLPAENGQLSVSVPLSYLGAELGLKTHATLKEYQRFIATLGIKVELSLPKDRELKDFSSGQKLMVRLQAALRPDRPLWLLDEPTRFLDTTREALLWDKVKSHCAGGGAVIVASHSPLTPWIPNYQTLELN